MRYRLSTLVILTAIGPPLLVVAWMYREFIRILVGEGAKLALVVVPLLALVWVVAICYRQWRRMSNRDGSH